LVIYLPNQSGIVICKAKTFNKGFQLIIYQMNSNIK